MSRGINKLFTPTQFAGVRVSNRFAVAPMTRVSATEDGYPTEAMTQYYKRFAKGGFGLIITEGLYTDQKYSQGYLYQPGMSDQFQADSWKPFVNQMHATGSKVIAQLMHAGALCQGNRFVRGSIGPSAVEPKGNQMAVYYGNGKYAVPQQATEDDLAEVIEGFASAARLATEVSGFDGVEIHAANGYLLDQFITDFSNRRSDKWGGLIRQRFQLALDVIAAVQSAVKPGTAVGVRISQSKVNDFTHKWPEGERAAKVIFESLAEAGVDYIHVTEFEAWQPAFADTTATLADLARRYAPNVIIITNGSLHDIVRSEQLLDESADIIAYGRGALSNPDLPMRVQAGQELRAFDQSILGPIASIKDSELEL